MTSTHSTGWWLRRLTLPVAAVLVALAGWYFFGRGRVGNGLSTAAASDAKTGGATVVEVVRPETGGIQRLCTQPGTVEPFESADIYAKASGFLIEQKVDIGSRVKKGDLLARISSPELQKQVQRDKAKTLDAKAKVKQMMAAMTSARADANAADASVKLAQTLVRAKTAYKRYREKFSTRINDLVKKEALEAKVADEQEDNYLAALEAENAAKDAVNAAEQKAVAAKARVEQAEADLEEAKDEVDIAAAEAERSQVLFDYTTITSPYTGVVTRRTFHEGDFIRSAEEGGLTPLFTIERTDLMRVVVQVPDRDVPYVHKGAPAVIEIDALPGVVYESTTDNRVEVARWSDAEDPATRTMRTEVDVKNVDGKLRHGMYGRATLLLGTGTPGALRIPSSALVGKAENGHGLVHVVRDGKVQSVSIRYATDNGVDVEIMSGLSPTEEVIVRSTGPVEDGTPVTVGNNH
jgi:RND family efflux transporter MFP subunit